MHMEKYKCICKIQRTPEFCETLEANGFEKKVVNKGVIVYTKDGVKYSVRSFSKSTGGPTAEYFGKGKKEYNIKLD